MELTLSTTPAGDGHEIIIGTLRDLSARVELERQVRVGRCMKAATGAAARLTSVLDVDRVLWVAVEAVVAQFDAALARIWLKEREDPAMLSLRASAGLSRRIEGSCRQHIHIPTHPFKLGVVARTRRPFTKNDLAGDPQFDQQWVSREGIAAAAALPLLCAGDLQGVLVAFFHHFLDDETFESLAMLSALVATTVNNATLYLRAQNALQRRDEVIGVVSHDLREPLSTVEMATNALLRNVEGEEDRAMLLRVKQAGERMNVLIGKLLEGHPSDRP
jgi:GAF domain-containing protein